jgi:hypothetical protein
MSGFNSSQKWPEGAIEDWQHGGSYGWIADKYGRGYSTVAKLVQASQLLGTKRLVDIRNRKRQGGRAALHERKPLGSAHLHVGLKISRFREIENDYSCSEFASMIKSNRLTVRFMELGLHDFKLSELRAIGKIVKCSLAELIGPEVEAPPARSSENSDNYSSAR